MLEGLQAILEKDIIVSTVNPQDLLQDSQRVEGIYHHHVATFIPMGDMQELGKRLAKKVQLGKTVKGLLTAPYGYGKTSSLAFLWSSCQEQGLLAVPPFYCATWLDILNATYGWVCFRLQNVQPDLIQRAEEIYNKFTKSTLEEMAGWYAQEHGFSTNSAKNLLSDLLERGSLSLELTPANLLLFLDEITQVVVEAGFQGLVIFPDEFQQYISKGSNLRQAIQEYREFIWGLATRTAPLGIVFSLPTYAESIVQEQGKDILHRLKDDQLYYRLLDIYSNDFPERLWQRYSDEFDLVALSEEIVEPETLRSIGQIVEREDLGEGPRTVIECFKRAIVLYQDKERPYTPVDLIDDFLETNIHFQSQSNRLKTVTRQALNSAIVDTPEKKAAIKLLAAFPRGCPIDVQKNYELYETINHLSRQAHGDLLTHLAEGYTLLGLQRGDAPVRTVDLIITEFWRGYEEDDLHLDAATKAFSERLLPRIFQRRRGTGATGWGELQFAASTTGSYIALTEGTFNTKYPRRRVRLQMAFSNEQVLSLENDADIQFNLLFALHEYDYPGSIEQTVANEVRFELNFRRKFAPSNMPEDIRKLQDYMNPELVTPLLMLSLVSYFDSWEEIRETRIPESEKPEIEFFIDRLVNHSVQLLFNQALGQTFDFPLQKVGYRMFEEIFDQICVQLYSHYHTFIVHAQYENVLNDYVNAMRDLNLKQRRGRAPIEATKEALARRFGLGSVATFENRAKNEYENLLEIRSFSGNDAEIVLRLHPLEKEILERLQSSQPRRIEKQEYKALPINQIADFSGSLGYRQEEILKALELLAARYYIRVDTDRKIAYLVHSGLHPEIIEERIEQIAELLQRIPDELLPQENIRPYWARHTQLKKAFDEIASDDEEELDELNTRLSDLEQDINEELKSQRDQLRQFLSNQILEIDRDLSMLRQSDFLDRDIRGQVAFVMHLDELRRLLINDRDTLIRQYSTRKETLDKALAQRAETPLSDVLALHDLITDNELRLNRLEEQKEALQKRTQHLVQWLSLLNEADSLFASMGNLPDLSDRLTRDLVPEIMSHFVRRRDDKRDSLADWEPFKEKIAEISRELEQRRRHGNDLFAQEKEKYEVFLRDANIGDWRLRSRYTYGEDSESYQDLYQEICAKLESRLGEIADDIKSANSDWLKAEYIHSIDEVESATIKRTSEQISRAKQQLAALRQALSTALIEESGEELERFIAEVKLLVETTAQIRRQLGQVLFADHKLDEQETKILSSLSHHSEMDLCPSPVKLSQAE